MGSSRRIVVVSVGVLALVGCTQDGEPTPSPPASSTPAPVSSTPAPSPAPPTAPPPSSPPASLPAGFSLDDVTSPGFPDLGGPLGGAGEVRVGRHSGYDRVVWEFGDTGRPTYRVRYVDEPTADGSGDPVEVRGDAYLEVVVTSVSIPDDDIPRPTDASAASLAGTVVAEASSIYGGFEGYGQSFIGVRDRERPFKVTVLADPLSPTRLVVDIASG